MCMKDVMFRTHVARGEGQHTTRWETQDQGGISDTECRETGHGH